MNPAMSKQQLDEYPILPDEIIGEILLRLPAKFIDRFKCVSKSWRSLLSSSLFFNQHLKFDDQILFFDMSWPRQDPHLLTLTTKNGDDGVLRKLKFPHINPQGYFFVAGSCHGLVLIMQALGDIWGIVVNPVTLKAIQIPKIGLPSNENHIGDFMFGLGYDRPKNDFKIVSISRYLGTGPRNHVSIYSLKTKTWRSLGNTSPFEHPMVSRGAFVGGCLHWVALTKGECKTLVIAAFNLATEEFENVPYPQGVECRDGGLGNKLIVLGGCLAMVIPNDLFTDSVHVWLMKEYGVQDSWTRFTIHVPRRLGNSRSVQIVCFLNENELVLVENNKFVAYDRRNGAWRDMVLDGTPPTSLSYYHHRMCFTESLASPNYS